ncbi:MAG: hypothetical protein IPK52_26155 [Chloroflexi bacterium]|nr:hypothetical protein [Chloroflexota bacterium]
MYICAVFLYLISINNAALQTIELGTIVVDRTGVEMVYVPPSEYHVGIETDVLRKLCEERSEPPTQCIQAIGDETGANYTYSTYLPGFWIDRYEVSNQQFDEQCIYGSGF